MSAEHDTMSQDGWDGIEAPQPLPNGVRFRYQGLGASIKRPENEGDDMTVNFVYRPVGPIDEDFDTERLPPDWQAQKVFVRFKVPSFNSKFDVVSWVKSNGLDMTGIKSDEQLTDLFKRAKPVIDATNKVRTYKDKTTGAMKFEVILTKVTAATSGGGDE